MYRIFNYSNILILITNVNLKCNVHNVALNVINSKVLNIRYTDDIVDSEEVFILQLFLANLDLAYNLHGLKYNQNDDIVDNE